jgi:hypothetical protein
VVEVVAELEDGGPTERFQVQDVVIVKSKVPVRL